MIRLLLVDDRIVVRQGLKSLLESKSNLIVVGEAKNGRDAISQVRILHPDIVLMDIEMPKMNGLESTKIISQQYPNTKILILTTFDKAEYVSQSIMYGARGYLLKTASLEELVLAIELLSRNHVYMKSEIFDKIHNSPIVNESNFLISSLEKLTSREQEVLSLLGKGLKNKEIARSLCLSESTIKNYVSQILSRLQLRDRTQAALFANSYLKDI